jgi:hypothetical protein
MLAGYLFRCDAPAVYPRSVGIGVACLVLCAVGGFAGAGFVAKPGA